MKEYLADLVRAAPTPLQARNVVREYLQARILGAMQRAGAMVSLAFHGGTVLQLLSSTAASGIGRAWIWLWSGRWRTCAPSWGRGRRPGC